ALAGSVVSAGDARLTAAGRRGVPQIVAPGAIDMIDLPSWRPLPEAYAGRPYHAHNRLIGSVTATADERRRVAHAIGERLGAAAGPTAFVLPLRGVQQWDREGEPLRDAAGIAAFVEAARDAVRPPVECVEVDAHVNDPAFCEAVLGVFDRWVNEGRIVAGVCD
ncbi:MAG: Tm-1-like ATP-binding domain-containing protein, partial [Burkholderiales bacterium]